MHQQIIDFWFSEISPDKWWSADPWLDEQIRARFLDLLEQGAKGELDEWRERPLGRLAEIIVLDQFSRNIHRGTPRAFSQDPAALVLAQEAVRLGIHASMSPDERTFLMMPFMHSESAKVHQVAERLFRQFTPAGNYDFELRHKAIIDRFGRFPHRNAILGRASTAAEMDFLKLPGSSF